MTDLIRRKSTKINRIRDVVATDADDDESARLRRRNAMRRRRRPLLRRLAKHLSSSDPSLAAETETTEYDDVTGGADSDPSSTKSSSGAAAAAAAAHVGDGDADDDSDSDGSATTTTTALRSRYASYDRAIQQSVVYTAAEVARRRVLAVVNEQNQSGDDSTTTTTPTLTKTKSVRSPFWFPWRSSKNSSTAMTTTTTPMCVPTFLKRNGGRSMSPGRSLDYDLDDEFDDTGPYLPTELSRTPSPLRATSRTSKKSAGCLPAIAGGGGSETTTSVRRVRSISEGGFCPVGLASSLDESFNSLSDLELNDTVNVEEMVKSAGEETMATATAAAGSILRFSVEYVAEEICVIDNLMWAALKVEEFEDCRWTKQDKRVLSPNIVAMVEWFNRLALMVATQILNETNLALRARILSRFIQTAHKLYTFKNFNSLKAILAGLQCTPIYRLKKTWKEVSSKKRKIFRDLAETMSENDNYAEYRNRLERSLKTPPCVPFLGIFLTDICQIINYVAAAQQKPKTPMPPTPAPSLSAHRRCVSSEVGAGHRIVASNPYTSVTGKDDIRVFTVPEGSRPSVCPLSDSGVGSSDSVHEDGGGGSGEASSPPSSSWKRIAVKSPSSPALTKQRKIVGVTTKWYMNAKPAAAATAIKSSSSYEGASIDVREICERAERIASSSVESDDAGGDQDTNWSSSIPIVLSVPPPQPSQPQPSPSKEEDDENDGHVRHQLARRRDTTPSLMDGISLPAVVVSQLLQFKRCAALYGFRSRVDVRDYLLGAAYNSEEENYRVSLLREQSTSGKYS